MTMMVLTVVLAVGPTDCLLEGELLKLGGPFLQMWQRKHAKLYPNRLEFYNKSRDGQVVKGKGVEVGNSVLFCLILNTQAVGICI